MRSAVILAGGNSSRLGMEKSLLLFDGKPLICWTQEKMARIADEVIIVARDENHAQCLKDIIGKNKTQKTFFTWDSVAGFGPVAGLDAGMRFTRGSHVFATGCDLPFLNLKVIDLLFELADERKGYEAAVPTQPNGFFEPLHSVYDREKMSSACKAALERGERRIYVPLQELCINRVSVKELQHIDPELLTFFNLNTQQDLNIARILWAKLTKSIEAI